MGQAEALLLDQVRQGDQQAWATLVRTHQGRLLAFARARLGSQSAEAEDVVQETLLAFVQGVDRFRGDASVETFLFVLLRRQIANHFRGRSLPVFALPGSAPADARADDSDAAWHNLDRLAGSDPTASRYVQQRESHDAFGRALCDAVLDRMSQLTQQRQFQQIKALELLLVMHAPNQQIAGTTGLEASQVAMLKHRTIQRLRRDVAQRLPEVARSDDADDDPRMADHLMRQIWEDTRPTCPKRSTLGSFLLGSLDEDWHDYVQFHLQTLGCRFCQANLDDLRGQLDDDANQRLHQRLMESTIGFLTR